MRRFVSVATVMFAATLLVEAQETRRPLSPPGTAATQVGGKWVPGQREQRYEGGKWIEILYSRPIKRERGNLFGSGADYGKQLRAGAPVWRAGANMSTRLRTEVPLEIGGKTVPAGEYSLFIDLKENNWTLIVSSWPALEKSDPNNKTALWGSFGYTPEKDVARAPMKVEKNPLSIDELTWAFADMTSAGGKLVLMWDREIASVPFKVASSS